MLALYAEYRLSHIKCVYKRQTDFTVGVTYRVIQEEM